jgi:hypothetical protein
MKCVKDSKGNVTRVSDATARDMVSLKKAVYVPKKEWKEKKG